MIGDYYWFTMSPLGYVRGRVAMLFSETSWCLHWWLPNGDQTTAVRNPNELLTDDQLAQKLLLT